MESNGIHVLIIEDDAIARSAYVELLSRWGFQTRSAHNGLAALVQMRRAKPDILLSDLNMPLMNGYELLAIVRRLYPEVRTIAMSASYPENEMPPNVDADAFYPKGGGQTGRLLALLDEVAHAPLRSGGAARRVAAPAPVG